MFFSRFLSTLIVSNIYGPFKIASTFANFNLFISEETIFSNTSLVILKPDLIINFDSLSFKS